MKGQGEGALLALYCKEGILLFGDWFRCSPNQTSSSWQQTRGHKFQVGLPKHDIKRLLVFGTMLACTLIPLYCRGLVYFHVLSKRLLFPMTPSAMQASITRPEIMSQQSLMPLESVVPSNRRPTCKLTGYPSTQREYSRYHWHSSVLQILCPSLRMNQWHRSCIAERLGNTPQHIRFLRRRLGH